MVSFLPIPVCMKILLFEVRALITDHLPVTFQSYVTKMYSQPLQKVTGINVSCYFTQYCPCEEDCCERVVCLFFATIFT